MVIPISSSSNAVLDDDEMAAEWELMQELGDETYEVSYLDVVDCSQRLGDVSTLLLFVIFALGVITGLIVARDMWRRMMR